MTSSQAQPSHGASRSDWDDDARQEQPAVRVHGSATPEEVAAVVAVLLTVGGEDGSGPERRPASTWSSRRSLLQGRHDPGPAAWRTTYRG